MSSRLGAKSKSSRRPVPRFNALEALKAVIEATQSTTVDLVIDAVSEAGRDQRLTALFASLVAAVTIKENTKTALLSMGSLPDAFLGEDGVNMTALCLLGHLVYARIDDNSPEDLKGRKLVYMSSIGGGSNLITTDLSKVVDKTKQGGKSKEEKRASRGEILAKFKSMLVVSEEQLAKIDEFVDEMGEAIERERGADKENAARDEAISTAATDDRSKKKRKAEDDEAQVSKESKGDITEEVSGEDQSDVEDVETIPDLPPASDVVASSSAPLATAPILAPADAASSDPARDVRSKSVKVPKRK